MRILIDGDACPSVEKINMLGKKYNIETILVIDTSHSIKYDDIKTIIVDTKSQSVDIKISNMVTTSDIVITNDYGLATICLSKNAKVLSSNGKIYNNSNIDALLERRYISYKLRKMKRHIKDAKKRTINDEIELLKCLENMITKS